jgi:hypothetical protein
MENIVEKIKNSHQTNLISLYQDGEQIENQQSMLLVLNDAKEENLKAQKSIQKMILKKKIKCDVFTQKEIHSALDVFPIEFMEMKENRVLLAGTDILAEIEIDPANLRHECEFYLRSNILKMRSGYLAPMSNISELIQISLPSFLLVFKYLLILNEESVPKDKIKIIENLSNKIEFNTKIFITILNNLNNKKLLNSCFSEYLIELEKIINQVDKIL